MKTTVIMFTIVLFVSLLSHQTHAVDGVWKTTTSFSGERRQTILSWSFNTTENVTSFTIKNGEVNILSSLPTSSNVTSTDKYKMVKTQTTMEIKITLTVYNITTPDSGVYRCSLDLLDVYKDIHLTITDLMPTLNPVISTLMENVKLVWEYINHLRYPANKLIFSRQNKKIAEWTIKGGFSPEEDHFRRNLIFTETTIKGGEIDVITLLIRDTNIDDFNKTYYCKLFTAGQNILTSELKLVVEIPVWIYSVSKVTAGLGEDATFIWRCKYSFQPHTIFIRKVPKTSVKVNEVLGYWYGKELHKDGNYTEFVSLNKTSTGEGEIIQLTLLNTIGDDYDYVYECDIIFRDGQETVWEIQLILTNASTTQHYSLTRQTNSEPPAGIPNTTSTYTEINTVVNVVCVFTSLIVVGVILGVVVYIFKKCLKKHHGSCLSIEERNVNTIPMNVEDAEHALFIETCD